MSNVTLDLLGPKRFDTVRISPLFLFKKSILNKHIRVGCKPLSAKPQAAHAFRILPAHSCSRFIPKTYPKHVPYWI